ncbi:DUF3305 domain-containing protein [Vibrio renipiscarius]|uniref:DUF3305 domain-containing protein n=1 Tax=Vibrio renipiscarius TaxID=1461322 RepID=A0A0C2NT30_9VIBR|nr:DUF3305 domain-containing protein [Vibrio renipiscarius]KII79355.1 hypothetical protein PL18_06680 [Vibrio renipiscarius]KII81017.1 hypothetical protein OJ16_06985 [Vibrio renipiscarius]
MSILTLEKTDDIWPIECDLVAREIKTGMWTTTQQELNGFNIKPEQQSEHLTLLQLHRDERTDYRFNLSSQQPKLFLILDNFNGNENVSVVTLTASQSVAAQYMDGDYLVLSNDIPLPIQAWMEAFIGRHGELLETRRKKRKGAGRSNGN